MERREPEFLTAQEVAQLLRVSVRTIHRLIHAGELPAVRVGRQWRVPAAALRELITPKAQSTKEKKK
ncbi:MAG: helix-turn-helix domain-containing protein [Candidatus Bipolaricaulaceae bacterium]